MVTQNIITIQGRMFQVKRKIPLKSLNLDLLTNTTLFIQSNSLEEILLYWRSNIQTLTYMKNCRIDILKKLSNSLGGLGPDRIVPIGDALKFDIIWDGINLFEVLTRESTLNV